jgi:hypothetical protein
MNFSDVVDAVAIILGAAGLLTLARTLYVIAYLPLHLSRNRRGVPMKARVSGVNWPLLALYFIIFAAAGVVAVLYA